MTIARLTSFLYGAIGTLPLARMLVSFIGRQHYRHSCSRSHNHWR
jgi:hypothetical protein